MPSQRPCAAFEPISPDLDVQNLVESTPNFEYVVRIHCDMIDVQGKDAFDKLVLLHVILGGKPLVVEGYHEHLDRWTFALQWLRDNCGTKVEVARDLSKKTNVPLTIGHYLNNMALLANHWTPQNYKDADAQRIYLKDIDCPQLWHDKLADLIPPGLFYLNESTGEPGGLGSVEEPNPHGPGTRKGRGIAKAGDLMSSLPREMRAENMMCYIGHEGTYTPAHREMCGSLGQNIMVDTSTGGIEDGKPTKPGSSIWFMTESKDRHLVAEYWLSRLGHDIEVERHFAQINAWKLAPFTVYVVEQRVGDLILIPPLAPHQVWNRGTRTMKAAWNRTTVETLELALDEALPASRLVCRDEQYKNKAIIYYTMVKYSRLVKAADRERSRLAKENNGVAPYPSKIRQLYKDFKRLHSLFTRVLVSESFLPDGPEKNIEMIPYDGCVICSYCRCNIFNRFLTCPHCAADPIDGETNSYDICMECYAMGRSCACISKLQWVEQWDWGDLVQKHGAWRHQILQSEREVTDKSPKSLKAAIEALGKRTLAQICQLELKKRPFNDISKPERSAARNRLHEDEEEIEVDDEGRVKRRKPKKAGDDDPRNSRRLEKRAQAADAAKAQQPRLGEHYATEEEAALLRLAEHEGIALDPALGIPIDPSLEDGNDDDSGSVNSESLAEKYRENPEQAEPEENFGKTPPVPQYLVPDGGIIRDLAHMYAPTEAITYDYPDPEAIVTETAAEALAIAESQVNYADQIPGYGPVEESQAIEMIPQKKRKRQSEGIITSKKAKATTNGYGPHSSKASKPQVIRKFRSKTNDKTMDGKPTLLVKLGMRKSDLEEINRKIASGLSGPALEPPKIASDLLALNTVAGRVEAPSSAATKKGQVVREEPDEDFVISKRRDRRRKTETNIPVPNRKTRARVVEYVSASSQEDESDTADDLSATGNTRRSRQLTERRTSDAGKANGGVPLRPFASFESSERTTPSSLKGNNPAPHQPGRVGGKYPSLQPKGGPSSTFNDEDTTPSSSRYATPSERGTPVRPGPAKFDKPQRPSMSAEEIAANRKAKLAAMAWAGGDDDAW
ncbi:hypothetical protein UCRPC4_g03936 [Phaeomoniella chlamydospora]|uniref:JmjC domain-containing protein n=1 Tax=Phaeomoniella chlamydospora TaxID=158046 RepID=A0A0G2EER5_PHACM|nr:hypothetical protein UCRPC4_g03936 [Phaeomoniella chlamydospora]